MRENEYKNFSLMSHRKKWRRNRPNLLQFELTTRCGLHCRYCYMDCYNTREYAQKELSAQKVKTILDKAYALGVLWVCFTGGDPLVRRDFQEIYTYAKLKGFIITIFTNGYSMTEKIAAYLEKKPPFVIELTLNAVTEDIYEKISQVKGSFRKTMRGISLILETGLPLKIKTQVTKDNLHQVSRIKKRLEKMGLRFYPDYRLHARLNADAVPCKLRILQQTFLSVSAEERGLDKDCNITSDVQSQIKNPNLFRCGMVSGDKMHVDSYGNAFLCNLIRQPSINLLAVDAERALDDLLSWARSRKFVSDSPCRSCRLKHACFWCPGKAYVETGNLEAPIEYYCRLTKEMFKQGYP